MSCIFNFIIIKTSAHEMCSNGKKVEYGFNPLNTELNPICHLLALLGGATIVVVSRLRVKYKCSHVTYFLYDIHSLYGEQQAKRI
jgi:hypothetical protein